MLTPRLTELLISSKALPFRYEPDGEKFVIGDDMVSLEAFATYSVPFDSEPSDDQMRRYVDESAMLLGILDRPYQTPKLAAWRKGLPRQAWEKVRASVVKVMMDVYAKLGGEPDDTVLGSRLHTDFDLVFIEPDHLRLSVLGNCACLGDLVGITIFNEADRAAGFAEYATHNVESSIQRTALMAGAGMLATLALEHA